LIRTPPSPFSPLSNEKLLCPRPLFPFFRRLSFFTFFPPPFAAFNFISPIYVLKPPLFFAIFLPSLQLSLLSSFFFPWFYFDILRVLPPPPFIRTPPPFLGTVKKLFPPSFFSRSYVICVVGFGEGKSVPPPSLPTALRTNSFFSFPPVQLGPFSPSESRTL